MIYESLMGKQERSVLTNDFRMITGTKKMNFRTLRHNLSFCLKYVLALPSPISPLKERMRIEVQKMNQLVNQQKRALVSTTRPINHRKSKPEGFRPVLPE